jgi:hypothetical protein
VVLKLMPVMSTEAGRAEVQVTFEKVRRGLADARVSS